MATRNDPRLKGAPDFGPEGRYVTLSLLGRGGMGEVYRVRDRVLGLDVALKVVRGDRTDSEQHAARFAEEAQIAAQLEHPGIVQVYDHGALPDGRLYFTMREVQGRTFTEPIIGVHADAVGGQFRVTPDGWTFLRLVQVLTRICEAVSLCPRPRGAASRPQAPQRHARGVRRGPRHGLGARQAARREELGGGVLRRDGGSGGARHVVPLPRRPVHRDDLRHASRHDAVHVARAGARSARPNGPAVRCLRARRDALRGAHGSGAASAVVSGVHGAEAGAVPAGRRLPKSPAAPR
ncbi:MAG: hypothetical protein EXR76_16345 [Myxococcales bacterium]|nr:hypothetical protein [Myxococcales bacterium]